MPLPPRPKGSKIQKFLLEAIPSRKKDDDSGAGEKSLTSSQPAQEKVPNEPDDNDLQPSLPLFQPIEDDQAEASAENTEPLLQPRKTTLR
jgi:hypothetical protein